MGKPGPIATSANENKPSIPDPARERAAIKARLQMDEATQLIRQKEGEIRSLFNGWFEPSVSAIEELFCILHRVQTDIAKPPKLAPWEKAVSVLLRDLDDVIASARGRLEYANAEQLRALQREAMLTSITVLRPPTDSNAIWYRYGLEILKSVYSMACESTGKAPSISHKDAKAIIVTQKALAACGCHVEAAAIVKKFHRKKITFASKK